MQNKMNRLDKNQLKLHRSSLIIVPYFYIQAQQGDQHSRMHNLMNRAQQFIDWYNTDLCVKSLANSRLQKPRKHFT